MPGKHRGRKSHGPRGGSRGGSRGGGRGGFPGRSTPGLGSRSGSGTATPNPGAFFPGPGGGRRNANAYGNPFRAPASHASPNWRVPYAPIEEEEVPKWSMSAEARNTDRHLSRLNGLQLRHKPVAFISGGTLAQENWAKVDRNRVREEEDKKKKEEESVVNKDKEEEDGEARKEEERVEANRRRRQRPSKKTTTETTTTTTQVTAVEETKDTAKENDTAPATDTDTAMESVQISMDRVTIDEQKTEPAAQETRKEKEDSDMSEDEVVFSGRRKYGVDAPESQGQDEPQPQPQPEPQATHEEVQKETIEEKTEAPQTSHTTTTPAEEPKPAEPETKPAAPSAPAPGWAYKDDDGKQDANDEANLKSTRKTKTKSKPKRRAAFLSDSEGEDDILRDYIENLDREGMYRSESDEGDDDDDEDDDDGVEEDEVEVVVEAGPSSCKPEPQKKTPSKPKDDDDAMNDDDDDDDDESEDDDLNLEAFDDLDTSDEAPATVRDILSIRERHNEVQYLVTGPNEPSSSARWVAKAKLTGLGAEAALENFLRAAAMDSEDDIDDLDDLDEDEADELDGDQDPDDFAEDMTDEQIARALARQEELGLAGGEEYMIFDGNEDIDFIPLSGGSKKKNKNKRTAKGKGKLVNRGPTFPSASALADAIDADPKRAYEFLDFEPPAPRAGNKGRRGPLEFELSDDELAAQLQASWEKDRGKKAARKREREELRHAGLLGVAKGKKEDMSAKYDEGMTVEDVKKELRLFLASGNESLSLPPMDKKNRKLVHEMAHMLNLKSLSRGNGKNRFPTLTKTSRTPHVRGTELDNFFTNKRVLRRLDRMGGAGGNKDWSKARGGTKAASYAHGEVVGASAPEIGAENKGRAMLEKMGWSRGTALGAENNKGILQPVAHIVRKGKAGLG